MMEGLFTLLSLSVVMAAASFLVGSLPLSFALSPSQLRFISTVGMGVLVGTALIVIIPEGVETLYSASSSAHGGHKRSLALQSRSIANTFGTANVPILNTRASTDELDFLNSPGPVVPSGKVPPKTTTEEGKVSIMGTDETEKTGKEAEDTDGEHQEESSPHAWVGLALISGFILMYLIDKLPQALSTNSKPSARTYHISLDNLGMGLRSSSPGGRDSEEGGLMGSSGDRAPPQSRSMATTTGLVIHAAADGIALGASSSANTGLSFIIFFAIMVHKAPAAFGLTSVLLKQGLSKRAARGHLLLFSVAAPAGALVTWTLAHIFAGGNVGSHESTTWWTGMLLLFSGGTFLYVAMHTMEEESAPRPISNGNGNGYIDSRDAQPSQKNSGRDLAAAVVGMILPLFLQVGHAH